ncbi:hypothetical protein EGW08_007008 [Elysia chlorotica]|uniref:Small monomeric GTPase n=1 Tax=Elysia chlorotica TaxID=188477 RepID=A0A3S1HSH5_ELYCH|nr:hypothetical protein EGW08_007008 [Elysia chlorotica]
MPMLDIQANSREKYTIDSIIMATVDIACNGYFGESRSVSTSKPQFRCNSWKERHHSTSSYYNYNNNSNSSNTDNRQNYSRRRKNSSPRLTRTNSASMPDCLSYINCINTSTTTTTTTYSIPALLNSSSNCSVCMVRSFKTTTKGEVLSTGSFCKVPSSNSLRSSGSLNTSHSISGESGSRRVSEDLGRTGSIDSSCGEDTKHVRLVPSEVPNICVTPSYFRTLVLGSSGVGKTSLVQQFTRADDPHHNEDEENWRPGSGHVVSVDLNGSESTMEFIDGANVDLDLESYQVDAYILVYSVSEPASFGQAVSLLLYLRLDLGSDRPVYLVANKTDLVRQSRVAAAEACRVASSHDCHFVETSTALNVKVDELLVGVLSSIQRQLTPLAGDSLRPAANTTSRPSRKSSWGRRGSAGKERRSSNTSVGNSGGSSKRKSLGLLGEDLGLNRLDATPTSFSCLAPGNPALSACRSSRSSSFSECTPQSKSSSSSTFSAISNFIKQACRRESKRRDAHA